MSLKFTVSDFFPSPPDKLYAAWLDSEGHAEMTGAPADCSAHVDGQFQTWGGYIQGRNLELETGRRILQSWRTTQFTEEDEDSVLEVLFEDEDGGTKLTVHHSNLPAHGMEYYEGWKEHYFSPMQEHFSH